MSARTSIYAVPDRPTACPRAECVYFKEGGGTCADPRTNKGNSDAVCHRWSNKQLLEVLTPKDPT